MSKTFTAVALAIVTFASAAPAVALTDEECSAAFSTTDANSDGVISAEEGARYYATLRLADKPAAEGSLSNEAFMTSCKAGLFDERMNDAGAPLKGANSFTEQQAMDRAIAHGHTNVSGLKLDGDGIWRGTATLAGKSVSVAIDYKGNVVSQ